MSVCTSYPFGKLFSSLFPRLRPVKRPRCTELRPQIERLEDRTLLSAANQALVSVMYEDLLQRPVDAGGLASWTAVLDQGTSPMQAALDLLQSAEGRIIQVQNLYQQFLLRAADPAGLAGFTRALASGQTLEQVGAAIVGSPEFYEIQGTDNGFLTALYQDALDRPVDASGAASFGQALAGGVPRDRVAAAIFGSAEFQQDIVQRDYQHYLHRGADAGGLANWTQALQQGVRDEQVLAGIVGSAEYVLQMQQPPDTPGDGQRFDGKPTASWKDDVRVATTGPSIALTGTPTIDGVALAVGDRVLVKDQTTASQNGIYIVVPGPWSRAADADSSSSVTPEMAVRVSEGVSNAHSEWFLTTQNPITLATTNLIFVKLLQADVRAFGARGDGSTNDLPAIQAAIATVGGTELNPGSVFFPYGVYRISTNVTLASNVVLDFSPGAALAIDAGVQVTFQAPQAVLAGLWQIFKGAGTVRYLNDATPATVYPEWWGAIKGGPDAGSAFNLMFAAINRSDVLLTGLYDISTPIRINGQGLTVSGSSQSSSGFIWTGTDPASVAITIRCFDSTFSNSPLKRAPIRGQWLD